MLRWFTIPLMLGILATACAPQVAVVPIDNTERSIQAGDLTVYPSPEAVGRAFQQIALLSIEDKRSLGRDEVEDFALLAEKARVLGAEAVVILDRRTVIRRTDNPEGGGDIVYSYPRIEAAAIVFEE